MGIESLNCRCCGGALDTFSNLTVCKHCGATNFISDVTNKYVNQLNHANKLRQESEFDNAAGIYDNILAENEPTADVLWYRTLCEYGIEYVPDPVSEKYFPTLHRINDESIFKCSFFMQALELSEGEQKETLLKEAKYIDDVQNKYLNIASNEAPYDVFICYKETDLKSGEKTEDVELAEELYKELTTLGYKVFFARETLKEKLSVEYEPYIFAALKSSKAMAVIGTKAEYFTSVWVKNEWGRFLKLMEKDACKQMFFACDDPEEMPRAFAGKQAQLLGNEGAIKNLASNIANHLQDIKLGFYNNSSVLSKEQQKFDRILAEKSSKFIDDIEETEFGRGRKGLKKIIYQYGNIAEQTHHTYLSTYKFGATWLLVAEAVIFIFFFATISATGATGGEPYEVEYYVIFLVFGILFNSIGLLILSSCSSILLTYGIPIYFLMYLVMTINGRLFNVLNTVLTISIPILILYTGLSTKGNRYYKKNDEAVKDARYKLDQLRNFSETARKEYEGFAGMVLNEYKKNYKASDNVQLKEHHFENVKSFVIEGLDKDVKELSSFINRNDVSSYETARERRLFTFIYFAIGVFLVILHFIVMKSPGIAYEIAHLLDAIS